MLNKLVDVLKEVFWLKKSGSTKKRAPAKKAAKKTTKKKKTAAKKVSTKTVESKSVKLKKDMPKAAKMPSKALEKPVKAPKPVKPAIDPDLAQIGEITHYFDRIKVCVVKITHGSVLIGDRLTIYGPKTKFVQKLWSMQIESQDVKVAKKGQLIGIKVDKPVVVGDVVYK